MSTHTPGPWTAERNNGYYINGVIHVPDCYEEYRADAALIVAAPELYATCAAARDLLKLIDQRDGGSGFAIGAVLIALDAALRKARGEAA